MTIPYPMPQQKRPSLVWIILPIVLVLAGAGSCSGLVYSGIKNGLHGRIYDSSGILHLDKGKYTLYVNDAHARLATQDGVPIPLKDYGSNVTFTKNGTDFTADKTFSAGYTGTYHLTIAGDGAVAIGPGFGHGARIGMGFGLGALLGVAALIALSVILVRRSRNIPGSPPGGGYPAGGYGYQNHAPGGQYAQQPGYNEYPMPGYGPPQHHGQQPPGYPPPQQPPS